MRNVKEYMRKYNKRPEVREKDRQRNKRPKRKAYQKWYRKNHKDKQKEYEKTREKKPERKAYKKTLQQTPKLKAYRKAYQKTQKYKTYRKEYMKTYAKPYMKNYRQTLNGKKIIKTSEAKRRSLGFIPLNEPFDDSVAHHINKTFVVYIPKELHVSIPHNIHTGKGMNEINYKVFLWFNGYSTARLISNDGHNIC
jgi:hypothetical protein